MKSDWASQRGETPCVRGGARTLLCPLLPLLVCLSAAAHPPVTPYQSPGAHAHPTGTNVLVLYNAAWPDEDGNGISDSADVAWYYAQRRAIPSNNVLALAITNFMGTYGPPYGPDRINYEPRMLLSTNVTVRYDVFYSNIVVPVALKLLSTNPVTSAVLRDDILFICPVYGMPYYVDTGFTDLYEYPVYSLRATIHASPEFSARLRSLDLLLGNVYRRYHGGVVWTNGVPRPGRPPASPYGYAPYWGDDQIEIGDPTNELAEGRIPLYFDQASDPAAARHFAALRAEDGAFNYESNGFFLVTRLDAPTPARAKGLVDKALYAERHLNNWAGQPAHPYYTRIYCGDDTDFSGALFRDYFPDNRGVDVKNWMLGVNRGDVGSSVFDPLVSNTLAPWDVVYDNHAREIGESEQTPRIHVTITSVVSNQVALAYLNSNVFAWWMLPPLENGGVLSNLTSGALVTLLGTNHPPGHYWVDTTNGCATGHTLAFVYPCVFPITDALFYTEYYTVDGHDYSSYNYRDCWQWAPGALAVYNQSWGAFDFRRVRIHQFAGPALTRGLTATAGALAEPLTAGIPLVPRLMRALSQGFCWAEACYNSLYLAESWMTVFIGDPLYNPFIALWQHAASNSDGDHTAPTLFATNDFHTLHISAWLGGATPDERSDVAQFRLYAGYETNAWSITNDFFDWPYPTSTIWVAARNYGWSRHERWPYPAPLSAFYYQVTARDPYGNHTTMPPQPVVIPEPAAGVLLVVLVCCARGECGAIAG